jgi:signal transduction histidine kinase
VVSSRRHARPADGYARLGRALAELNAEVVAGRDPWRVLERLCAHARALATASSATVLTADSDGVLVTRAVAGPVATWQRGVRVPVGDTLAAAALRGGAPLAAGLRHPRYRHERALAAAGLRRVLYLPIPGFGSVTGVLGLGYRHGGGVTARELRLLEPLATVAGLVPPEVAPDAPGGPAALAAPGRPGDQLQALVDRVVALTGAIDCAVYLPDGRRALVPVAAAVGSVSGAASAAASGAASGAASAALDDAGPVDPATVSRLLAQRRPATLWRLQTGSVLCVPLPARAAVLGALCARWADDGQPGPAERMLINLTAGEAAHLVDSGRRRAAEEEQVAVREREWLARELHDSVVQTLYGISLGAGAAGGLLHSDTAQAQQSVAWIQETAVAGLTEMQGLIQRLRPDALADNGLTAALGRLLETLHTLHGCRTSAELGAEPAVGSEVRRALYRIAQEAIANAAKHARAGQVTLRLRAQEPNVVLEIIDDGQGFTPGGDFRGRLGIRSMRERAEAAGGRLDIVSAPGRGTMVRAELPAGA